MKICLAETPLSLYCFFLLIKYLKLRMFTTQDTRKQAVSRDEEERISRGW